MVMAPALLDGSDATAILADKVYDSYALRKITADSGVEAMIPSNRTHKKIIPPDQAI